MNSISFAIFTGITCGLCLGIITCFSWRARMKYRLRTFGKSTIAKVEYVNVHKTHISSLNEDFEDYEEHTTYSYTWSFKKIITEQGLRYILQKMASAYNVHLPTDIIDLCLEYSANSFIIYYPIMINGGSGSNGIGDTFNVRYDPKYPKCNDVYNKSSSYVTVWCFFIWSALILCIVPVIPMGIGFASSYAKREDKGDGVFEIIWITCVSMICVLLIVVCAIYIIMSRFALKSCQKELQCIDAKSNSIVSLSDRILMNNSSKNRRQRELSVRRQERERMRDRLRKKREIRNNDDDESNINTFDLNNGRVKSVSKKKKKK
eukprot:27162_1